MTALFGRQPLFIASAIAVLFGVSFGGIALASRFLGLGTGTNFRLYEAAAISRYELLQMSILLFSLGLGGLCAFAPEYSRLSGSFEIWKGRGIRFSQKLERMLSAPLRFELSLLALGVGLNFLILLAGVGHTPVLFPDSSAYLNPGAAQSLGYPILLSAIFAASGSLDFLVPIQLNLLFLSLALLGCSVRTVTKSSLAGFLVAALLMLERYITDYAYHVLTECLFTVFIALHVAAVMKLLSVFSLRYVVLSFVFLAAATVIRPAGYSMFAAVPLLAILLRPHWKSIVLVGGGIIVVSFLGAATMKYSKTNDFAPQSFGGINLVGQVSPLIRDDTPFSSPGIVADIVRDLAPFRQRIEHAGYPKEYWMVTAELYNPMLSIVIGHLSRQAAQDYTREVSGAVAVNDLAMSLALATIRANYWGYARHVLSHYCGMWWSTLDFPGPLATQLPVWREQTIDRLASGSRFGVTADLYALPRISPARAVSISVLDGVWAVVIGSRIFVLAGAFIASVCGFWFFFSRLSHSPVKMGMIYLSAQIHAYFLFIASVEASGSRYAIPFEPLLVTLLVLWLASFSKFQIENREP